MMMLMLMNALASHVRLHFSSRTFAKRSLVMFSLFEIERE